MRFLATLAIGRLGRPGLFTRISSGFDREGRRLGQRATCGCSLLRVGLSLNGSQE
jgi:hypothetical protein